MMGNERTGRRRRITWRISSAFRPPASAGHRQVAHGGRDLHEQFTFDDPRPSSLEIKIRLSAGGVN